MFASFPLSFTSLSESDRPNSSLFPLQRPAAGVTAEFVLTAEQAAACCPLCDQPSRRVHSRYTRTLADLPCQGRVVRLLLRVRRFFCATPECPRIVFAERLPDLAERYARTTIRLRDAHRAIGFAMGGEAGARLSHRLHMPTSPDTLLRRVKTYAEEPTPSPRVVGVDDWAWRKGRRYGTILVDLERGRVIDLLPDRDGQALKTWLKDHPDVEIITRDRSAVYAQAATEAAPQAKHVADRWHLLKNLRETIERLFERCTGVVKEILAPPPVPRAEEPLPSSVPVPLPEPEATASRPDVVRQARRERRQERYAAVHRLHQAKVSIRAIAKRLRMSRGAVRRYLREERCPDWQPGHARPTGVDRFRDYIDWRIREGCQNAAALHRELADRDCRVGYEAVRRFMSRRLAAAGQRRHRVNAAQAPIPQPPSARRLSYTVVRRPQEREAEEQGDLTALSANAELQEALGLAEGFASMARKETTTSLVEWLAKADQAASAEVRGFAQGLRHDEAAVAAGLTEKWSNGPVEGAVNRLKTIKRQMYGRAGFQLLRARVRHAS